MRRRRRQGMMSHHLFVADAGPVCRIAGRPSQNRRGRESLVRSEDVGMTEGQPAVAATDYDVVAEEVEIRLDAQRVRRCLDSLTELQRESVTLAYYGGYTYREVAGLLGVAVGTVKTRMRDGLIRLRDCLGDGS